MKSLTTEAYKIKYFDKHPNSKINIVEKTNDGFIVYETKYGKCKTLSSDLMRHKSKVSVSSAINKTKYFINQAKEIYDSLYDYSNSEYITLKTRVKIKCQTHGEFEKTPHMHLWLKQGCPKCGREILENKTRKGMGHYLSKMKKIHGNKYTYPSVFFDKRLSTCKIKINCSQHGYFSQTINNHISGNGCPVCGKNKISKRNKENPLGWSLNRWQHRAEQSMYFESFKFYILRCYNDDEKFYKIGRTFNSISVRFKFGKMPYKYETIKVVEGSAEKIFNLELKLKKINKTNRFFPVIDFKGKNECFSKIDGINLN